MAKKSIYILRHGDIGLGSNRRYIGQTDIQLSDLGKQQATSLKNIFSRVLLDKIYCSDLGRAQQTADIIAEAHQILPSAREELRELNMGAWEGKPFSEIREKHPLEYKNRGEDIANYRPPLGESFYDCYRRVIPVFESLTKADETNILIVGHAGVNRIIMCHVLGMPLEHIFRLEQRYGCINLICKEGVEYRLKYLNHTCTQSGSELN